MVGVEEDLVKKRGMFFSLMALTLGILIMLIAAHISQWSLWDTKMVSYLAAADKAKNAYQNIEDGLVKIASLSTKIEVENDSVKINASLPAPNIDAYIRRYMLFESIFSDFQIRGDTSNLESRKFYIMPNEFLIWHKDTDLELMNTNQIKNDPASYDIEIILNEGTIDSASWSVMSIDSSENGLPVKIRIRNERYSLLIDYSEKLNRSDISVLNLSSANQTFAEIVFMPESSVKISSPNKLNLKISLEFKEPVYVESKDRIDIISEFGVGGNIKIDG